LVSGCDQNDALGFLEGLGLEEDAVDALVRCLLAAVEAVAVAVRH